MRYDEKTIRVPDEVHEAVLRALEQIESMNMETGGFKRTRDYNEDERFGQTGYYNEKERFDQRRHHGNLVKWVGRREYKGTAVAAILLLCVAAVSTTSVAAINFVRARMEAMDKEQQESYWEQVYLNRMGRDTMSRPFTQKEIERLEALAVSYEGGVFPEGAIRVITTADAYDGTGIAYLEETGTFYVPDAEMTDEELLQIIDFRAKRDYSLSAINEEMEQSGTDLTEKLQEVVKWEIPDEIIPYEGEGVSAVCAGKTNLWLGSKGSILRMEVGAGTAEVFCDGLDESCEVRALCERVDGSLLAASWDREDKEHRNRLWMIGADGKVLRSVELSYIDGFVRKIVVDKNGKIYLKGGGVSVLDEAGQFVAKPVFEGYRSDFWWAVCVTDDGEFQMLSRETNSGSMDILAVDPETLEVRVVARNVFPEDKYVPDLMMRNGDEYLFWSYAGLWRYDMKTGEYSQIKTPEEYPVTYDSIKSCVAEDGSICLYFWRDGAGFCCYYDNMLTGE